MDIWQRAMFRLEAATYGPATEQDDFGNGDLQHVVRSVVSFFEKHGEIDFGLTAGFGTGIKLDATLSMTQASVYFGTGKVMGLAADATVGMDFGNAAKGLTTYGFIQGGSGLGGYVNFGASEAGPFTSFGGGFEVGRAVGVTTGYTISASYEDIWHAVNSIY